MNVNPHAEACQDPAPAAQGWLLSRDEVRALTGSARKATQLAWLIERGFPHELGADGHPRVLRAAAESRMSAGGSRAPRRTRPNLDALPRGKTSKA